MSRAGRFPVVIVLIVSLLGSWYARDRAMKARAAAEVGKADAAGNTGNVSQLNSYALGLLLGGLRGPMLMALWTTSENQKNDKELEDFDTKIELIRLLQAEFDGVHLFQIWNKAFNISVQMANVPTKYVTILDAMDYAYNVNSERPDNINILSEIGRLYFDKFGGAAEKAYYSPRLMDETLPVLDRVRVTFPANLRDEAIRQARLAAASPYLLSAREVSNDASKLYITLRKPTADALKARWNNPAVEYADKPIKASSDKVDLSRRAEHDSLLDANYNLLPQYLAPREGVTATGTAEDGSELPYLKQFQPFKMGVSPYALSYNFYKRSQWLQKYKGARHIQMSDRIISVRPAMSLKKWGEEDWYAARRAEIEIFGLEAPRDDAKLEPITQRIKLDEKVDRSPLLEQTIWRYKNSAKVEDAAVAEYQYHLQPDNSPNDEFTYRSHVESSEAQAKLMMGDALYLEAMIATGDEKIRLAQQSANYYRLAATLYTRHIFRFFMGDEDVPDVLPRDHRNLSRADLGPGNPAMKDYELPFALLKLRAKHMASNYQLSNSEDFVEINSYVERCNARVANINLIAK